MRYERSILQSCAADLVTGRAMLCKKQHINVLVCVRDLVFSDILDIRFRKGSYQNPSPHDLSSRDDDVCACGASVSEFKKSALY
jgi:hypothetical protein